MASTWETIATNAQQSVLDAIPAKWRLSAEHKDPSIEDKTSIPRKCGLLTPTQLAITESSATELVEKLRTRTLSSVEVVEAYCARAAIAHQLVWRAPLNGHFLTLYLASTQSAENCYIKVNCLAGFFPEEALEKAKQYDETLAKTGKPVGPLHGLPIAVKVNFLLIFHGVLDKYVSHNSYYDRIHTGLKDSELRWVTFLGMIILPPRILPWLGSLGVRAVSYEFTSV